MKVVLATDHAGFELKEYIRTFLEEEGVEVYDLGAHEYNPDDDYPGLIAAAAYEVSIDPENVRGIILGGSGQGEALVANRFENVRAIVYYGEPERKDTTLFSIFSDTTEHEPFEIISLSREHNDANVLSLGARFLTPEKAIQAISIWMQTPYSGEERHERRISQIDTLFNSNETDI